MRIWKLGTWKVLAYVLIISIFKGFCMQVLRFNLESLTATRGRFLHLLLQRNEISEGCSEYICYIGAWGRARQGVRKYNIIL